MYDTTLFETRARRFYNHYTPTVIGEHVSYIKESLCYEISLEVDRDRRWMTCAWNFSAWLYMLAIGTGVGFKPR